MRPGNKNSRDNDGDLDLFLVNNAGTPRLYRNDGGNANRWLRVQTVGTVSNREGLGARVIVHPTLDAPGQIREIGTSSHFLGQRERTAHFGLTPGAAPVASVFVKWPSGRVHYVTNVPRNTTLVLEEPTAAGKITGSLQLQPGLNLIGSLADATQTPTLGVLLQHLGSTDTLISVSRLDRTTQQFITCAFNTNGTVTGNGCDAPIDLGEGWIFQAHTATIVPVT